MIYTDVYYRGLVETIINHFIKLFNEGAQDIDKLMEDEFKKELQIFETFYNFDKVKIDKRHAQDIEWFNVLWNTFDNFSKKPRFKIDSDPNGKCMLVARDAAYKNLLSIHNKELGNFNIKFMLERASILKRQEEIKTNIQFFINRKKHETSPNTFLKATQKQQQTNIVSEDVERKTILKKTKYGEIRIATRKPKSKTKSV
jgi:hypothetical protein